MGKKFKFLLIYFISWVAFFDLLRVVFVLYHFDKTQRLSFETMAGSFWHGLKMDLSVAAYITALVCLFTVLGLFIPFFARQSLYKVYTAIVLFLASLIALFDLEIYGQWGFRMDITPLRFLADPGEAFASISHLPLYLFAGIFIICFGLFYFAFGYVLSRSFYPPQSHRRVITAALVLVFMGGLIVPIRGGFQLAPLNQSSVYFSSELYANHAAVNSSWNFLHSVFSKGSSGKNPYQYLNERHEKQIVDSLYAGSGHSERLINFSLAKPTNVILVIWESFTEKAMHISIDGKEVLPNFNRLKDQGVFFSNMYASGDRTNKGIPAILSGYPAMPNTTIIHSPAKAEKLPVLPALFSEKGYYTPFFYGGEPEFANIKSYLLHAGFNPIIGKNDFASKDMNSKWGAHDGVVMNRVVSDLGQSSRPFFATWLTLTSHEPFETPVETVFKGADDSSKFLNSLHYTDKVIGDFIARCSLQPWWANTVIIITGDHGHPLPANGNKADDFRTPMLWVGGALTRKNVVIDKVVSQLDIAGTLAFQAGFKQQIFPFSKNVLDSTVSPWSYFNFNDGFGFVNPAGRVVFDNVGKRIIRSEGKVSGKEVDAGKALMQDVYQDFISK